MKKILLILLVLFGGTVAAQQSPFFSHFALNPVQYNPGWLGLEDIAYASLTHRSQWITYPNGSAPTTQNLTMAIPLKTKISGIGINIVNDNIGPVNNIEAQAGFSYTQDLRAGTIAIGVMPGVYFKELRSDDLIFNDDQEPLLDGLEGNETQTNFDMSAGVFFQSRRNFYLGLGVVNILTPNFNFGVEDFKNKVRRTFSLSAGTVYDFRRNLKLQPVMMIRSDLKSATFDLGSLLYYKDRLWGGVTFRLEESANILLGYSFLEDKSLKAGYSFEYIIQNQESKEPVSFELFLRYDLPNLIIGGKKPVRTPRYTF